MKIIDDVLNNLKSELENFLSTGDVSVDHAETFLGVKISNAVLKILSAFYEEQDKILYLDKKKRKQEGLSVQRLQDKRQIITQLGVLEYHRNYYKCKDGGYIYPIDAQVGIDANQKVSGGVSLALVEAAQTLSYAKSSAYVTGGQVSKQTVMQKIRGSQPKSKPYGPKRQVAVLHIDADEEHVHLHNGKSAVVPLVCVYEGISHSGDRGHCEYKINYSAYDKKPAAFWEEILSDLEKRYELDETTIYLHGDGAAWIKQGLEWLPNARYVLDPYHKNKYMKKLLSGIPAVCRGNYSRQFKEELKKGNRAKVESIVCEMLERWPEQAKSITEASRYLLNNIDGIAILEKDPEAGRGGATEPHVSHILSSRLSSRPMAWSKATLERFVPILAAGGVENRDRISEPVKVEISIEHTQGQKKVIPFTLGLPNPDIVAGMPGKSGHVTALYNALRPF